MRRIVLPSWAPRLTPRGWTCVVLGATLAALALWINQQDLFVVACLLVVAPLVALGYVAIRPGEVGVARSFRPPIVPAGSEALVVLELRNLSMRPLDGASWRDSHGLEGDSSKKPGLGLPALDRHRPGPDTGPDSVRLEYTVTPRRRGVFPFGPLVIGRKDPFGFALREHPIGQPHDLVVTPQVTPLPRSGGAVTRGDGTVRDLLRSLNPMSDELIAREYRPGDPLRRVNWPATARHGEIMVRQEEQRSNPEARIILATTTPGVSGSGRAEPGRSRGVAGGFELAIELVASIGVHLLDAGLKVQLVETGPSQLVAGSTQNRGGLRGDAPLVCRAPGGERQLLEGLANLEPVARASVADGPRTAQAGSTDSGGGRLPTFAVLWSASEADAAELAGMRGRCEPAVAFVLESVGLPARALLRDSGWQCISLRSAREIPAAWENALARRDGETDDV
ncbi:DUF58 domain-containing protein [Cryobacterium roopkundense]|uniref:Uncharacterized protein (DUF58 family) n=1 Tax=Cryobacterium roopkundense TaxID=1001240 RepID=A0A7W8ZX41_9MICO|nr:DUF58 domain-containing protein [Cryobacterium roopkundense]MBB5641638.1 uncharacterized protein (DUF58 family) [Cryobacterium roopkundense]